MAIIKCKMCGGELNLIEGQFVAECEYCGSRQTVPAADNEKKLTLFARANRLRSACDFDKAAGIYESIVADFPEEAEAYWGLVLCKYGIEYVDDPATGKKIPTCHRSNFDSVMDDSNFDQARENADEVALRIYRQEAKQIEQIRKGILEVSSNEQPFDIFICYKETDSNGDRTVDSLLAQNIYDALTAKGYRVFFSRITLEDKLGQAYEPYIFAALNSAKIMLAVGTCYEHYNAVWVKNEWSRYLKIIAQDKFKYLIPCYKSIDAYDIPKEFAHLQGQDMGKVGAIADLLRGIEKLLPRQGEPVVQQVVVEHTPNTTVDPLLKRVSLFLEDGDWKSANEYCEKVLDMDPENSYAYLGKLMADLKVKKQEALEACEKPFDNCKNYQKAIRFGDEKLKTILESYIFRINRRNEEERIAREKREVEARKKLPLIRQKLQPAQQLLATGSGHTVGLKEDGTVAAVGKNKLGQCGVNDWRAIIAIAAGSYHTVGLKADGTVAAVGADAVGQWYAAGWKDIVAIAAGTNHTVGLKADGTVAAVGANNDGQCNVAGWRNIVAIAAGSGSSLSGGRTVGLKSDGTVVAVGENEHGQCNVTGWKEIVAIAAGLEHTVGLKADGTVVAVGDNVCGQCDVSGWRDIVVIAAGALHTVGLKGDGTVVAVGSNTNGQCDVTGWEDIVAISAELGHTVGMRADGTVVAVGDNQYGQCNVTGWRLFKDFEQLEANREKMRQQHGIDREKMRQQLAWCDAGLCGHCGGTFKGLFTKKCTICGKPKDY